MDIDVARHTVRQSFRIGRELQDALLFLKEHTAADDDKAYAIDIAAYPQLEKEIEDQITSYGGYL